jgi:hypothetical protein
MAAKRRSLLNTGILWNGDCGNDAVRDADPVHALSAEVEAALHDPIPQIGRIAEQGQGAEGTEELFVFQAGEAAGVSSAITRWQVQARFSASKRSTTSPKGEEASRKKSIHAEMSIKTRFTVSGHMAPHLLWRLAARIDSRIESVPCGSKQWEEGD